MSMQVADDVTDRVLFYERILETHAVRTVISNEFKDIDADTNKKRPGHISRPWWNHRNKFFSTKPNQ